MSANDGSVYEDRNPRNHDGKRDYFFNEQGSHAHPHGHVVESRDSTPENTNYDYVRDVNGDEYINRRDGGGHDRS